jgi:hypothetical protein
VAIGLRSFIGLRMEPKAEGAVRSPMQVLQKTFRFARKPLRDQLKGIRWHLEGTDWYWKVHSPGNDRTTYVIGLFGTGRWYINQLMLQNIGRRAKNVSYDLRFHRGPTSLIYIGHATIRYVSSFQALPAITDRIFQAVRSRFADVIFIYRHPLDSLLTNWVWWRTYLRYNIMVSGLSEVYKNTDELCVDLEQNFTEFKAFAEGDPDFFAAKPGSRYLSFPEFLEETELYLGRDTLALRLEDFMIDPLKEFSKITRVMSLDLDSSRLRVPPPRAKANGYLTVKEKVPRFRNFINELDNETKRRIEKIGYNVL